MPNVRKYFPAEGGPEELMTAVGPIGAGGLDAAGLPMDQIIQLDRLVTSGILDAEGEAMNPTRELTPWMEHMVENKVTRAASMRRPYAPAPEKLAITKEGAAKSATVGGGGQTMTQITGDKSPSPKAAQQDHKK